MAARLARVTATYNSLRWGTFQDRGRRKTALGRMQATFEPVEAPVQRY
jgi:hypothetical protein